MVLLPEGKIINNPDTVKLIKVLPTTLNDETFFVVVIKLDDDSELMLDRCATRMEAESLADRCTRLLNGEELDSVEIPSFVEETAKDEESSDWDMSSEEEPAQPSSPPAEEESSSWDMSSEEAEPVKPAPPAEEESSSWGMYSEDVESKSPSKASKPKIQQPYTESEEAPEPVVEKKTKKSSKSSVKSKSKNATPAQSVSVEQEAVEAVAPKSVPRVTGFIEDDSDEWVPDNGLDDWYD